MGSMSNLVMNRITTFGPFAGVEEFSCEETSKEEKLFHERMIVQATITYHYTMPCALTLATNSSLGLVLHPSVTESLLLFFYVFLTCSVFLSQVN